MGRKAKRWRGRAERLASQRSRLEKELEAKLKQALRDVRILKDELANGKQLNCFRTAIENLPFGRMGGELLGIRVTVDPRMLDCGFYKISNGDPMEIGRHVRYICDDLARKVQNALMEKLECVTPFRRAAT